ncbi:two-component system response regulator [Undibacterium fentianense]|uniref:EAL domain-containing protein n=1 Tax=Undibacterium fentianense TaxID=2828728 RepID=A0A941EA48_9BURK|nr:EAL domain-containing protein [Undibacterium fentianense]MBR7801383.1 EAL domain-containing protein [Undibacterium fentianense]
MQVERILIVEDEPVVALDLQQTLEEMGHKVLAISHSFETALEAVVREQPSLVMMDINLQGDIDGIDACDVIYQSWRTPVIFLTAYVDEKTINRAAACHPFGYIMKPYQKKELHAALQIARARHNVEKALARSEERLALVVEAADLSIWEWNSEDQQLTGDPHFQALFGTQLQPYTNSLQTLLQRIHPDDHAQVRKMLSITGFFNFAFRYLQANGDYCWLELYGNLRERSDGHVYVLGAVRDITQEKQVEQQLLQSSVVYSAVAEGIMILDAHGQLISTNPAFTRMTGFNEDEVLGQHPADFLLIPQQDQPSYANIAATIEGAWSSEALCQCRDGRVFNTLQQICAVRDEQGKLIQFVHTIADLTAIRASEKQLVYLAYHDSLTRLPNRRMLMDRLQHTMLASDRNAQFGAILFIDLDKFKLLNDTLGHDVGDILLTQVAERLQACVRECDTVARLGGDEFIVMLEQLQSDYEQAKLQANVVGKKILDALNMKYQLATHEHICTPSMGIALFQGSEISADTILKRADLAMYQSKKLGRNQVSFFDPDALPHFIERRTLEFELRDALQKQEFLLHFQIQVDHWRQPIGVEALIRWQHPELGLLLPSDFIPLAEENGAIIPIGLWVLEQACQQLKAWQASNKTAQLSLSVNISGKQLQQADFAQQVLARIAQYSVPAHLLRLEITEGVLLGEIDAIVHSMNQLNAAGVRFALDDFGVGYSSLQYLKRLPIDQLKIDHSFIQDLEHDQSDRTIVRTIVAMANNLGVDVIAEGVENELQLELLRNKGCVHFQGYLFGRPIDIRQLNGFLS